VHPYAAHEVAESEITTSLEATPYQTQVRINILHAAASRPAIGFLHRHKTKDDKSTKQLQPLFRTSQKFNSVQFSYMHTEKLQQDKFICLTYMKGYQLVSRPSLGPHRRCMRVWLRCRRTQQLFVNYSVHREYLSLGRNGFYINYAVRRDYSSPGRMCSTSTTP
jgi:hypothetical protein